MSNLETGSLIFAFVLSYFGVKLFRRWCLKREVVDIPNERSSHTIPTPRGGGLVIVFVSLAFYTVHGSYAGSINWAYILGAVTIAAISWFDDLITIKSFWRFLVHSIGAIVAIVGIGILNLDAVGVANSNWVSFVITFLWIVWLTNAYNFMDGIDGIAATQAITAGIGWFLFGYLSGVPEISYFGSILIATNLGFLIHNWSPAKIFMGDVGSAFLGYTFAVIPLLFQKSITSKGGFIFAIFAVALFLADSVFTFFRRLLNGEKVWEAHRSHFYQRLVLRGYSHSFVTSLYGILSLILLLLYFLRFWIFEKA